MELGLVATGPLLSHLRAVQAALRALPELRNAAALVRWEDPARSLVARLGLVAEEAAAERLAGELAAALQPLGQRRSAQGTRPGSIMGGAGRGGAGRSGWEEKRCAGGVA